MANAMPRTLELGLALESAEAAARELGHPCVRPEHCLFALLNGEFALIRRLLRAHWTDEAELAEAVERALESERMLAKPSEPLGDPYARLLASMDLMTRTMARTRAETIDLLLAIIRGLDGVPIACVSAAGLGFNEAWRAGLKIVEEFEAYRGREKRSRPAWRAGTKAPRLRKLARRRARDEDAPLPGLVYRTLVRDGLVLASELIEAMERAGAAGGSPLRELIRRGGASETEAAVELARRIGAPLVEVGERWIDPDLIEGFPAEALVQFRVFPLERRGEALTLAICEPETVGELASLEKLLGCEIAVEVGFASAINAAIEGAMARRCGAERDWARTAKIASADRG